MAEPSNEPEPEPERNAPICAAHSAPPAAGWRDERRDMRTPFFTCPSLITFGWELPADAVEVLRVRLRGRLLPPFEKRAVTLGRGEGVEVVRGGNEQTVSEGGEGGGGGREGEVPIGSHWPWARRLGAWGVSTKVSVVRGGRSGGGRALGGSGP